jgi:hypothetical protein
MRDLAKKDPERLLTLLDDAEKEGRPSGYLARMLEALARSSVDSVVPTLFHFLEHNSLVVQEGALLGLAGHPTPQVVERIREVTKNKFRNRVIQEIATEVLEEIQETALSV